VSLQDITIPSMDVDIAHYLGYDISTPLDLVFIFFLLFYPNKLCGNECTKKVMVDYCLFLPFRIYIIYYMHLLMFLGLKHVEIFKEKADASSRKDV
jgi:hypothetical protein